MINAGSEFTEELVGIFVSRIQAVDETHFKWYLSFYGKGDIMEENSFDLLVKYNGAFAFRKKRKEMLRENQWIDLKVGVSLL